jgi:pimeloyl-ACP methyl ester carboxylesterase
VITGRADRLTTPRVAKLITDALPRAHSQLVTFERSAHRPWAEEAERYFQLVETFLAGSERIRR